MDIDVALIAISLVSFLGLLGTWILAPLRVPTLSAPVVSETPSQPAAAIPA